MKYKTAQGFTLIELLIVIAVLGILAVAVLSAINPIEQINRSRDTGGRSDAEQLLSAIDRFYASQGYYPWKTAPDKPAKTDIQDWSAVDNTNWSDGTTPVLSKLSEAGTGELKASFVNRITGSGYNTLYVYNRGNQGDTTYVCFAPKSASFNTEAWNRCGQATDGTGLPADLQPIASTICISATDSYSCLP